MLHLDFRKFIDKTPDTRRKSEAPSTEYIVEKILLPYSNLMYPILDEGRNFSKVLSFSRLQRRDEYRDDAGFTQCRKPGTSRATKNISQVGV